MVFSFRQKVLFKHCDPAGIVFYPRYVEMVNDCVEAFFETALDQPFEILLQDAGVPTVRISLDFPAPSRHGDSLGLSLVVVRLGRSSVDLTISATCKDQLRFNASLTLVYVDSAGRPQPWTPHLRSGLSSYIGEPQ